MDSCPPSATASLPMTQQSRVHKVGERSSKSSVAEQGGLQALHIARVGSSSGQRRHHVGMKPDPPPSGVLTDKQCQLPQESRGSSVLASGDQMSGPPLVADEGEGLGECRQASEDESLEEDMSGDVELALTVLQHDQVSHDTLNTADELSAGDAAVTGGDRDSPVNEGYSCNGRSCQLVPYNSSPSSATQCVPGLWKDAGRNRQALNLEDDFLFTNDPSSTNLLPQTRLSDVCINIIC